MVVSVNPFKDLPIYGDHVIDMYEAKDKKDLPPHLYAISKVAIANITQR